MQLRMSEDKTEETFIELPLCLIRQKYAGVPNGEKFIQDLQTSDTLSCCINQGLVLYFCAIWGSQGQKGKDHPQSKDPEWRIYKLFDQTAFTSPLVAFLRISERYQTHE